MPLSRGASRCLSLLQSYAAGSGKAFPYQETIAKKLNVKPRMVRYYLAELKASGFVEKVLKRQHSSAQYCLSDCRSDCRSGEPVLITELKLSTSEKLDRKPPGVEIPPMEIQNEYGRWIINPAWPRYRDLANSERVRRAKDPDRYLAAVWARELQA
jgi:hypothetical protein